MSSPYFTHLQQIKLGHRPRSGKKLPVEIAKKSAKMQKELQIYLPAVKIFLALPENQFCKIKMDGCRIEATHVHHAAGRLGIKLHDQADWIPTCWPCHRAAERKDKESRRLGFIKSRLNIPSVVLVDPELKVIVVESLESINKKVWAEK
jgi:hypothetical protein